MIIEILGGDFKQEEIQVKKYSEQIYKIRKAEGLSQEEFGNKIGVSRQMVSKWEIGESSPRTDKINKICTTFGITPAEFISDDEEDKENKKITKIIYNNKKGKVIKSQQLRQKIIKRISILIISVISAIYIICSLCKFIYLKSLNKKMLKFKETNNYYFILTSYMDATVVDKQEVWYLDGKYKIEETYNNYDNNIMNKKYVCYIDTINQTEKKYLNNKSNIEPINEKQSINYELYSNGTLLYNNLPQILCSKITEIVKTSFKFGLIKVNKSENTTTIEINGQQIIFDQENKIEIRKINKDYSDKKRIPTMQFLNIQFDCVTFDEVNNEYEK